MNKVGRIEVIIGCMFAGKTSEMLRRYNRYIQINKSILLINHESDKRYGENIVCSHDKKMRECYSLSVLDNIYKIPGYMLSDIIMIEEAQFFSDLVDNVVKMSLEGKDVIVCGLSGDCFGKPFGEILNLIPHADSITHLKALCKDCGDGTEAIYTKRLDRLNQNQTVIGTDDSYKAVCRRHYYMTEEDIQKEKDKKLQLDVNIESEEEAANRSVFSLSTNSVKELKNIIERNILNKIEQKQSLQQTKLDELETRRKQLENLLVKSMETNNQFNQQTIQQQIQEKQEKQKKKKKTPSLFGW